MSLEIGEELIQVGLQPVAIDLDFINKAVDEVVQLVAFLFFAVRLPFGDADSHSDGCSSIGDEFSVAF